MKKKFSRAAAASALGVALVLAGTPGVAHADTTKCVYHGYDRACLTNYSNNTYSFQVCDNENDAHSVVGWTVTEWYSQESTMDLYSSAGCAYNGGAPRMKSFYLCETGSDCTGRVWMY